VKLFEAAKTLAKQFAPQGSQAEQSETEQGKCRACIGNARWGHADVVEVKEIAKYRKELELQLRAGARRGGGERVS
jgi:hypothetical protein